MFVAISLVAEIASGLIFTIGVTRLEISYEKSELIRVAGKKGLLLSVVLMMFPLAFIARVLDFFIGPFAVPYIMAALVIAVIIVAKIAYEKVK